MSNNSSKNRAQQATAKPNNSENNEEAGAAGDQDVPGISVSLSRLVDLLSAQAEKTERILQAVLEPRNRRDSGEGAGNSTRAELRRVEEVQQAGAAQASIQDVRVMQYQSFISPAASISGMAQNDVSRGAMSEVGTNEMSHHDPNTNAVLSVAHSMRTLNTTVTLTDLSKPSIIKFAEGYESYVQSWEVMRVSGAPRSVQSLLRSTETLQIKDFHGMTTQVWHSLDAKDVITCLYHIHQIRDGHGWRAWEQSRPSMDKEGGMDALLRYRLAYAHAVLFIGKYEHASEKLLGKLFAQKLAPPALAEFILRSQPGNWRDAARLATIDVNTFAAAVSSTRFEQNRGMLDQRGSEQRRERNVYGYDERRDRTTSPRDDVCRNCGKHGHFARNCPAVQSGSTQLPVRAAGPANVHKPRELAPNGMPKPFAAKVRQLIADEWKAWDHAHQKEIPRQVSFTTPAADATDAPALAALSGADDSATDYFTGSDDSDNECY